MTNATSNGHFGIGVYAMSNATVTVNNNVIASGTNSYGINVIGTGTAVTVGGHVTATFGEGVLVVDNANATVKGNVTGDIFGVHAVNASITVNGDVKSTISSGAGVLVISGSNITIDGAIITSFTYIRLGGTDKTQGDYEPASSKTGYLEYTDNDSRGACTASPASPYITALPQKTMQRQVMPYRYPDAAHISSSRVPGR